jgi:putative colanic acid biosynthesis UDP-glucose lipid carrier transferase
MAARLGVFLGMSWLRGRQVNHLRVLLVGAGGAVGAIRRRVKASTWTGYELAGVLAMDELEACAGRWRAGARRGLDLSGGQ